MTLNMTHLNLMPEAQKRAIEKDRLFLIAHNLLGLLFLFASAIAIVLILVRFALLENYNKIKAETSLVNAGSAGFLKEIDALNAKILLAEAAQQNFSKWSGLLFSLSALAPDSARLNYLFLNRDSGSMRLSGAAADRNSLLLFKAALENSGLLENLEAPLSNLLEKTDLEFRLNGAIKKDAWSFSH